MKIVKTLVTFALLAYGTASLAADTLSQRIQRHAPRGITAAFYSCIDQADSNAIGSGACLSAEKTRQDHRLNTTYQALLGKLDPKAKSALVIAEREWLKSQDATGRFEDALYGEESVANLEVSQNEIFRICERANALAMYLSVASI